VVPRNEIPKLMKTGLVLKLVDVDEDDRRIETAPYRRIKHLIDTQKEEYKNLEKEKATLKAENLAEKRRLTDVELKAKAMLANVDLLIIPRLTLRNVPARDVLPNRWFHLAPSQFNAVKTYLKQGKPVLFLLGPANEDEAEDPSEKSEPPDQLEPMLAELGFHLPKQTILFNIETREYNQRKFSGPFARSKDETEVPGLKFDDDTETGLTSKTKETWHPHPIRTSLKLMHRTTSRNTIQDIRVRHPRPVYRVPPALSDTAAAGIVGDFALPGMAGPKHAAVAWFQQFKLKPDQNAAFLVTHEESWNTENPFIVDDKIPRFTPAKDEDPKKNTVAEERPGPFPIAAAVETPLPPSWFGKDETRPKQVRVAVIGSGGIFIGKSLQPMQEKMLLDVANWLLGRDDLLARDVGTWQYPRVSMSSLEFSLWEWGARLGLPLLFIYLGTVVMMVRRMR
jgi:hypothetical protein